MNQSMKRPGDPDLSGGRCNAMRMTQRSRAEAFLDR